MEKAEGEKQCRPVGPVADAMRLHAVAHMGRLLGCQPMPAVSCLVVRTCLGRPACWVGVLGGSAA